MKEPYNGYSNYPTWACVLHLHNEYYTYNAWRRRTIINLEETKGDKFEAKYNLAAEIQDVIDQFAEETITEANLMKDLLRYAVSEIDFVEVAESFIEE